MKIKLFKKMCAVSLSALMLTGAGIAEAVPVNAADSDDWMKKDLQKHTVGIVGTYNSWFNDTPMTDNDGDGIYTATIIIDNVTSDMIGFQTNNNNGYVVETGKSGILFKVRLDKKWTYSWADYDETYGCTENSQTLCCAEATPGRGVKINVYFNTNKPANANPDYPEDYYKLWEVSYTSEISETEEEKFAKLFSYTYNSDGGVTITGFTGDQTDLVIPAQLNEKKVTAIGKGAFSSNNRLQSVVIPDGVTEIGEAAFKACTALTSVILPDSLIKIDGNYGGSELSPANGAFSGCTSLKSITIPDSVQEIGGAAFYNCTNLKSISIPDSVTSIGIVAFCNCENLEKITLSNNLTSIMPGTFTNCKKLKNIIIPDSVTSIISSDDLGGAFSSCTSLKSITIPDTVTNLGYYAFLDCTALKSVKLSKNLTGIRERTFYGCTSLTSITLPEGITALRNFAFSDCTSLKKITIPESVTQIAPTAFYNCNNLIISGKYYSYAETYADTNNIPFISPTEPLKNTSTVSSKKVELGNSVTINLSAVSGKAPYKYSVLYKKSSSTKWTTLTANTTKSSVVFTPKAAATYNVKIIAKDSKGNSVTKILNVTASKPLANTSKLGAATVKLGEKVKVRCFATGGTGSYTYAVYYKKASKTVYTKLRGYKDTNIVMFKPAAAVKYDVQVKVKDSSGKVVSKVLTLSVTK